jgi:hypothetical protein
MRSFQFCRGVRRSSKGSPVLTCSLFRRTRICSQFRSVLLRVLSIESKITEVAVGGRPVRLDALPIAIAHLPGSRLSFCNRR